MAVPACPTQSNRSAHPPGDASGHQQTNHTTDGEGHTHAEVLGDPSSLKRTEGSQS
jgi:hypothetical protein